jgi:hypothetical protein
MKRLTLLIAVLLLMPPVIAQDALAPEPEEPDQIKRYTVEVIIFAYAQEVSTGTEIFVPDVVDTGEFYIGDGDEPLDELEVVGKRSIRHLDLEFLRREEYTLLDTLGRMERLDVYEPLMHFGWTQAAWEEEDTPAIELRAFGRPPAALEGSLTLYLSRYLHLVVDLEMAAEEQPVGAGLYSSMTGPVRYRIEEDRILKNGEIRYFDHPKFGMIAKVTRVEPDEAPAEEAG